MNRHRVGATHLHVTDRIEAEPLGIANDLSAKAQQISERLKRIEQTLEISG